MNEEQYTTDQHSGERLDVFLSSTPNITSRSQAQKIIAAGLVFVNQKKILFKDYKLQKNDEIVFSHLPALQLESVAHPLEIHYEDESLLVVYKPAGLIVHPASSHQKISLVHYLLAHTKNLSSGSNNLRKGIVHRLDKDTSGILVVAKNDSVHADLAQQFKAHSITRKYLCFSVGKPTLKSGTIDKKIRRHPKKRTIFCAIDKETNDGLGKNAKTDWKILQTFQTIHLLECRLHTGKTHQIRVHLSSIGMPLLGDKTYGKQKPSLLQNFNDTQKEVIASFSRQALHAVELGFQHPVSKKELFFSRPMPQDMEDLLNCLKTH